MSEFVYESSAWHNRATIAREAGVELASLGDALETVVSVNYFGIGCDEGAALFAKLRTKLDDAQRELIEASESARALDMASNAALNDLRQADDSASASVGTGQR